MLSPEAVTELQKRPGFVTGNYNLLWGRKVHLSVSMFRNNNSKINSSRIRMGTAATEGYNVTLFTS